MNLTSIVRTSAQLALLALCGCSHARCKEAGCFAGARVDYEKPITTPYQLTVRTGGLVLSAQCPLEARDAKPVGPSRAILFCDGDRFVVETPSVANGGATPVGSNPVDAKTLNFDVELKRAGARPMRRSTKVELTEVLRPNGPNCPAVCYSRQGKLNLDP